MNRLSPSELNQFARRYRFAACRVRRVRVLHARGGTAVEVLLSVPGPDGPVRLRLRLDGAEEYRFQKRPGGVAGRPAGVTFGYFQGSVFVNLDTWPLPPGDVPGVHDFRASDAYVGGRDLSWDEVPRR